MYHNRKREKKKKFFIIVLIILLLFLALFYSLKLDRKVGPIEKTLKSAVVFIEKVVMYPFTSFHSENNIDQSDSYLIQKNVNSSLEKEIEELKKALELNRTFTEYDTVNATVLSRNKSYWFHTITVDKGTKDGIKADMAVVTKDGLVGKTAKVTRNSSEIKLITSDDLNYKVSVSISLGNGDTYAILSGYDQKTSTVKVTGVDKDSDVKEGDVVLTSGLGGLFPRGIYVGTVHKIDSDKYNLSKTLYVKTSQDFNQLHYVTILKEKK